MLCMCNYLLVLMMMVDNKLLLLFDKQLRFVAFCVSESHAR